MSSKDLTVLFGLAVAYVPHRSNRPSTARSNSRPRSADILRVRGLSLLRRVQMKKRHHVQLSSPTKPAAWCGEQPCRKKIELKERQATPKKRRFFGPLADRPSSSPAIPWVFAELYRKTRQLEALNAELERRVEERTKEPAHAKEQLLTKRMLAFAHREDRNRNSRCFH
jgi:hypothetical protein